MSKYKLRQLSRQFITESGGNLQEGVNKFNSFVFKEMFTNPNFKPTDFSISECFRATVLALHPELVEIYGENLIGVDNHALTEALSHSMFPKMTGDLINKVVIPSYELELGNVINLVTTGTTNRVDFEYIAGIKAKPALDNVPEGMEYPSGNTVEKNVRLQYGKFGKIIDITKETLISDQTGMILSDAKMYGEMMGAHQHRLIVETFVDAARNALKETSSTSFYYNGSARTVFHATTHATIDGQTNPNLLTSANINSIANWKTAFGRLGQMKNEEGEFIQTMPKQVVVNPLNKPEAYAGTVSDKEFSNANNAASFIKREGLEIISSPYIGNETNGNTTDWYLTNGPRDLVWLWVNGLEPGVETQGAGSETAFRRDIVFSIKPRYAAMCGRRDYRYTVKCQQ